MQNCRVCGTRTYRFQTLDSDMTMCSPCWQGFLQQDDVIAALREIFATHFQPIQEPKKKEPGRTTSDRS